MRTIGVTEGASEPDLAIWPRLSMYCRLSRSARMSHGLCSISYTMPSYLAADIAIAVSGSAWQNDVNAGLPASRARITPFRRGISAMLVPCARGSAAASASTVMRGQKRVEDARKRAYDPRIHLLCTKVFTKMARARLRGVQVCFCLFSVIVVQQLAGISLLNGPRPRRMNWPFRDSVCAVRRRAGACRLMQVTARIRLPTARDAHDWRVHRRSSPTAEVWNSAG